MDVSVDSFGECGSYVGTLDGAGKTLDGARAHASHLDSDHSLSLVTLIPTRLTERGSSIMTSSRILYVTADLLEIGTNERGEVAIRFDLPGSDLGLAPGLSLAAQLSPQEARDLAGALLRKADDAEAQLPRA